MLSPRQQACLKGIGIDLWRERVAAPPAGAPALDLQPAAPEIARNTPSSSPVEAPPAKPVVPGFTESPIDTWPELEQSIQACNYCGLAEGCSRKVPGKGDRGASLMIIGEAPGRDEDLQGKPFVGRAGQLLDRMLQAIDIDPSSVYITNILKCRPPQNRDPKPDEISACARFLQAQIDLVKPQVIFAVGRISAQNLLNDTSPVGRLRGHQHQLPESDIPLLVTYHPAYLLRNPAEKAKVWQDLKALHRLLDHAND